MIAYTTLGTNNVEKAKAFYQEVFSLLDARIVYDTEKFVAWTVGENQPMFSILTPYDGNEATFGNGTMIGIGAGSPEKVKELHAKVLELGGKNEGDPGEREGGYYCGYCRDLDNNKLNFICIPSK